MSRTARARGSIGVTYMSHIARARPGHRDESTARIASSEKRRLRALFKARNFSIGYRELLVCDWPRTFGAAAIVQA
eukprot:452569-Prorocentrum_minimum.AAC.1